MDNQPTDHPNGLWDKKTYISAAVSAVLATVVALTVCAVRGETLALGQASPVSVSNGHTASSTGLCSSTNLAQGK